MIRPLTLLNGILLARLLAPEDFGAIALAMVLLGSTNLLGGLGMEPAVIHSDLDTETTAFHAFVITVVSSLILFTFVIVNASWLATLLGDPSVRPVLLALSPLILTTTLSNIPTALAKKQLRFGVIARSGIASALVFIVASLVGAYLGLGLWSLVIGELLRSAVATLLIWIGVPGWQWLKPVPWRWPVARSLLGYGLQTTGSGLVQYFYSNWDEWLVGRRLGTEALGFYSKAYDFTNRTIRQLSTSVVGGVFFPTYTKIRDDRERLRNAYLQSVRVISTIMFPIGFGFFATAPLLIPVVLGDKWLPMTATFMIYSITILTRPIATTASSIFGAVGVPKYITQAGLVLSLFMVPIAFLLLDFGIAGVAAAVVAGEFASLFFSMYRVEKVLPGSAKRTLSASTPALAVGLMMLGAVFVAQHFLVQSFGANIWTLMTVIALGVIIYALGMLLFQREFTIDLLQTAVAVVDRKGRLDRFRSKEDEPES